MKSEIEIRDKLTYYQTMLASIRRDDIIKKAIAKLPQEDQKLFRRSFEGSWDHVQRLLESRIGILKWILGENLEGRDV